MQQQFQQMPNNMPTSQMIQQQLQGGGMAAGNMIPAGGQMNAANPGIQQPGGGMAGNNTGMGFNPNGDQMIPGGPQQSQWSGGFNQMQQQAQPQQQQPFYNQQAMGQQSKF